MQRARALTSLLPALLSAGLLSCTGPDASRETPRPVIVIGVDGGEWSVVRALWREGRLPNLKRLAEAGVQAELSTDYGISPVIWTTMATGRTAQEHGITDFVVAGPQGNVPVSSAVRRVPALWNMLSMVQRRVGVLGWYATWPAEAINGVMITDNVMRRRLGNRVHPAELRPRVDTLLDEIQALPDDQTYPFGVALSDRRAIRDLLVERLAPELAAEDFDLLLVYFRVIDHLSHFYWKYWEPDAFDGVDPEELRDRRDWIAAAYDRFDKAVGDIVAAAPRANVLIVSDHGFHAVPERLRIYLELDELLHHLGYLEFSEDGVDLSATRAYTFGTSIASSVQTVKLSPRVGAGSAQVELDELRERFVADIQSVRYQTGEPVFAVREPDHHRPGSVDQPGMVRLDVLQAGFSPALVVGERVLDDVVLGFESVSGGHAPHTKGVFIAHGPDIRAGAAVEGISIFDVAPTVLCAAGLPVADDFAGVARQEIFEPSFLQAHPLRTIATWGGRGPGSRAPVESVADDEILDELRSLGYLQ